jgi:FMN phosphatase YigB (HAD superfamily)
LQTAILTNATDTIPFQHVLDSMHAAASTVFFTDDSLAKLAGAATLGMAMC